MASSLGFGDTMFPDTPDVLVEESADYNLIPDHLNGSTHAISHDSLDYNYLSYYSFSSYFVQYDFGFDHQDRTVIYIVIFFFLLLLVLFGLLSNVFQLYGIVCFPRIRQDVQHIFIANMTIVDIMYFLLVGIANMFVCALEAFSDVLKGIMGDHFVRLQISFQIVHTAVIFHLASMITALAFDQYLVVVYPIVARKWRTPRNAVIVCVILWTVGIFVAIADGLSFTSIGVPSIMDTVMLTKDSLVFILFCLVPTIMTIAFNMMTWYALHNARTATSIDNHQANNAQRFTQLQEEGGGLPGALVRTQDLPNNVAITASFVIFWGIYHIIHLVIAFIWALKHFDHWIYFNNKDEIMIIVADLAVHFNVALNPLFYATCNPKFRQHLYQVAYALAGRNTRAYTSHIDQTTTEE